MEKSKKEEKKMRKKKKNTKKKRKKNADFTICREFVIRSLIEMKTGDREKKTVASITFL